MSFATAEQPNESDWPNLEEPSALFEARSAMDMARANYAQAAMNYSVSPRQKYLDRLSESTRDYVEGFGYSVEALADESEPLKYLEDLTASLKLEDNIRVGALNQILKDERIAYVGRDFRITYDQEFEYLDPEEAKRSLQSFALAHFADSAENDTLRFIECVNETLAAKWVNLRHEIGKHVLSVAETTTAVALGILITRRKK